MPPRRPSRRGHARRTTRAQAAPTVEEQLEQLFDAALIRQGKVDAADLAEWERDPGFRAWLRAHVAAGYGSLTEAIAPTIALALSGVPEARAWVRRVFDAEVDALPPDVLVGCLQAVGRVPSGPGVH
ncbi:MAG: hypothetical protein U0Q12_22120 [Vicinamibacterales bacterium]